MTTKPEFVTEEHLVYLDRLSGSGTINNMFRATPLIEDEFPELTHVESLQVLTYWMKTFTTRQQVIQEGESDSQS